MQIVAPRPTLGGLMTPLELPDLEAWYDLSRPASTTSDDIRIDSSNRVRLIADKSGNSAVNCLCLNGVAGNYASAPDSAALDIPGDFDIRIRLSAFSFTAAQTFVAKYGYNENERSFRFGTSAGGLYCAIATVGTALNIQAGFGATGLTALSPIWIRLTYDQDSGAGQYALKAWSSANGTSWTQVGVTSTGATIANTYAGSAPLLIGAIGSLATNVEWVNGNIYRVQIRDNILDDGTGIVFDADFTAQAKLVTSFTESSANAATVTINATGDLGARIAGERDLYQATASKQPVLLPFTGTKYGYLNGVAGNYFSTPDSAAVSVTGDIDLIYQGTLDDWTPANDLALISKDAGGTNRTFSFRIAVGGAPNLYVSLDGTAISETLADTVTGFADGAVGWVRVLRIAASGLVRFYKSSDGVVWTQLGADKSTTAGNLYDGTQVVEVGSRVTNTSSRLLGCPYRAQIWAGNSTAGGTLAADFNPALYTSGTTFTASTGEVWTINGGAHIVTRTGLYFDGSNDYIVSAALSVAQPYTLYPTLAQLTWTSTDRLVDVGGVYFYQKTSTPTVSLVNGPTMDGLALKTTGMLSGVASGASSTIRYNRQAAATGDAGTGAATAISVGAAPNSFLPANVFVSELAFYSAAHGTSTQDRMALYAGRRHSFAV